MTTVELRNKIEELKELEALIKEAEAEVEALKDELKAEMTKQHTNEMQVGRYTMRWTDVASNRLDSKKLKETMPNIYDMFVGQSYSKRFSIVG